MKEWIEILQTVFNYLKTEELVEPLLELTFNDDDFTYYNPIDLTINVDLVEVVENADLEQGVKDLPLVYLLHEVGHHVHDTLAENDFVKKTYQKDALLKVVEDMETYEERYNFYRTIPLEEVADANGALMLEYIQEHWDLIFGLDT